MFTQHLQCKWSPRRVCFAVQAILSVAMNRNCDAALRCTEFMFHCGAYHKPSPVHATHLTNSVITSSHHGDQPQHHPSINVNQNTTPLISIVASITDLRSERQRRASDIDNDVKTTARNPMHGPSV